MTGQILEIATDNKHLSAKDGFIVISEGQVELGRIPIDAVEAVVVSAHGITYSHSFWCACQRITFRLWLAIKSTFPFLICFLLRDIISKAL